MTTTVVNTTTATIRYSFDTQAEFGTGQTPIMDSGTQTQLDSILYFSNWDTDSTPLFGAVGGWITTGDAEGAVGLLAQWVSYEPDDMISYWGGDLASLSTGQGLPVSVERSSLKMLGTGGYTEVVPGSNVYEAFGPTINMRTSVTTTAPARLILLRESAARKVRQTFHFSESPWSKHREPSLTPAGSPESPHSQSDVEAQLSLSDRALTAIADLNKWLLLSLEETAELCRFSARSIGTWQAQRDPHVGTVRRLFENPCPGALAREKLGRDEYLIWLNAPSSVEAIPRLHVLALKDGPQRVLREAAPIIFPYRPQAEHIRPDFEDDELLESLEVAPVTQETSGAVRRVRRPAAVEFERRST